MVSPSDFYQENIVRYTNEAKALQKKILLVSFGRLISFLVVLVAGYFWIRGHEQPTGIITLAALGVFFILVKVAFKLGDKKALTSKMLFINTNEANILQQRPNQFSDGRQFAGSSDYSADLDVFGVASIFHLLNRTTTTHGITQLAAALQQSPLSKQSIEEQQQAIQTLQPQKELRQLLTANGLLYEEKEGTLHDILSWLKLPTILHQRAWVRIVRWLLPLYNVAGIIFYLFTDNYAPLIVGVFASWLITGIFTKRIMDQHQLLSKKQSILEQYAAILHLFSKIDTGSSVVLQQQKGLASDAHRAIKKLSSLAGLFDQRLNLLVNIFLNSFFLYDIQCMWALEDWKAANKDRFNHWIQCVGAIESLNSLATFAFNYPGYCVPVVQTTPLLVQGTGLAHPLIAPGERVANDFTMGRDEQLVLVTGSNMSGKTTFLRTMGVNIILAQCGAPVCATSFSFTPMAILSSIRVSDSLQEHTSYFMAELKRLQQIIQYLQQHETPALILIDEILRGTNSEDKTHGSEQFIKKLLQYRCLTMFATHDLTLSKLEEELPGKVNNYCFESTIRNDELLFDYTLQRGVAKNKNASFLMRKMEII